MPPADRTLPGVPFLRGAVQPVVVTGLLAFAVFAVFAARDDGYPPTVWYPGALFLLALVVVLAWARPAAFALPSGAALASIGVLAAFTAWTYLSISWSEVKGDAWDGANRGLLYLIVYLLFITVAWRPNSAALMLAAYSLAIAVLGVYELVAASRSGNPDAYFLSARFAQPTGYHNANCALFSMALWPAWTLAARRESSVVLRAIMLPVAGVLVELALLSQSRGWLASMPIVFLLYLAVVPGRVRTLAMGVTIGITVVAASGPLLDLFPALRSGDSIPDSLRAARTAVLVSALALLVVGALIAALDRRLFQDQVVRRRVTRAAGALFAILFLAGAVAGSIWLGNPVRRVEDAWHEFKSKPVTEKQARDSYFTAGFGSNRYDLWRVALKEFARAPLVGVGSDNFATDYLRLRRTDEETLYPHSLELKVLVETGVVGALLFVGFLSTAVLAWLGRREEPDSSRALRAAALIAFAYWLVHGSIDWFWESPGLAAPAFAFLGLAIATRQHNSERRAPRFRRRMAASLAALGVLAAAASLFTPWLAAKEVQVASGQWRDDSRGAFRRLDRARLLNPLSDEPDLIAGAIASRIGETARMTAAFQRALERNPRSWYAHLELAVAHALAGRRRAALVELREAAVLNPREPTIRLVRDRVLRGERISTRELDRIFLQRTFVTNRQHP